MDEEGISVSVALKQLTDLYEESVRELTDLNRIEQGNRQYIALALGICLLLVAVFLKLNNRTESGTLLNASEFIVLAFIAGILFILPDLVRLYYLRSMLAIKREHQKLTADLIRQKRRAYEKDKDMYRSLDKMEKEIQIRMKYKEKN